MFPIFDYTAFVTQKQNHFIQKEIYNIINRDSSKIYIQI